MKKVRIVVFIMFAVFVALPVFAKISVLDSGADVIRKAEQYSATYSVGDKVMVKWKGNWWKARVIGVGKKSYKIHYDGYGAEWDEWVGPGRIKRR